MDFDAIQDDLLINPKTWAITGVAGFIGSNLLEALLKLDQTVIGLDNFSTSSMKNLLEVKNLVSPAQWDRFNLVRGDIRDMENCKEICQGADIVLHEAALGSVPRSIEDPIQTNSNNIDGFLNMLVAARDAGVKRFVYAASSSTYGDHEDLPKVEDTIGNPLSPYAVTKLVNELYANVFGRVYGFHAVGLRYFNVFGPRQDPEGAYAAVIPKWFSSMVRDEPVFINGDGDTSRDFCFIDNVVQANILAACVNHDVAGADVYNVAYGDSTTLTELFGLIRDQVQKGLTGKTVQDPIYRDFRNGDIRHSMADIEKAKTLLGYDPKYSVSDGLALAAAWYLKDL